MLNGVNDREIELIDFLRFYVKTTVFLPKTQVFFTGQIRAITLQSENTAMLALFACVRL